VYIAVKISTFVTVIVVVNTNVILSNDQPANNARLEAVTLLATQGLEHL